MVAIVRYSLLSFFFFSKTHTTESLAGKLFALTVFLCDGYLQFRTSRGNEAEAAAETAATVMPQERFFRIALVLPMDLQMLLCNRTFGLGGSIIFKKESEAGFKKLGRLLAADSWLVTN